MTDTEIYVSSNGDRWILVENGGVQEVEHRANIASGGAVTRVGVASFLAGSRNSPEQTALRELLAKTGSEVAAGREVNPRSSELTTRGAAERTKFSIIDEVERMSDEIEDRKGPHSDPAY